MSAIHERQWALQREREIRAEAHRRRMNEVSNTTELYLRRYEQTLNDLQAEGLEEFMQAEFNHARSEIRRVRNMDAWEGREVSRVLGSFMYELPHQAREARRIHQEHQRLLQEEQQRDAERKIARLQAEKEAIWQQATSNWQNKLARNLAFKALAELKQQAFNKNWSEADISQAVEEVKLQAEQQAVEKQQKFTQSIQAEVVKEQKTELLKTIEKANLPLSQSARLKKQIEEASGENITQIGLETAKAEDEAIESENVRKEMVKAVYQSLKMAGFTVLDPKLQIDEKGNNIVLVQAARPNGNSAKFRIRLDGSVMYEFDNYKGQRCKADMQQVLPKLSEIYGIDLSKERVIWENPDDEKLDAKPINPIHSRTA